MESYFLPSVVVTIVAHSDDDNATLHLFAILVGFLSRISMYTCMEAGLAGRQVYIQYSNPGSV